MRELMNALFFVLRGGCPWRMLPEHFPPHQTAYRWFPRFRDDGTWENLNHHLVMLDRERVGREGERGRGDPLVEPGRWGVARRQRVRAGRGQSHDADESCAAPVHDEFQCLTLNGTVAIVKSTCYPPGRRA